MPTLNNIFFWIAVVISVITVYKMYLSKRTAGFAAREFHIPETVYPIAFALAVFVSVFVRIYQFGSTPDGFNQDGAMAAVDAKALADYGTDRFGMKLPVHLTGWGYGQMSALLSYLMAPFIKLAGLNPVTARLPQLLVSLAGLYCLYLFIRDAFNKNAALVVFFFAAVNPWHILQSRWALDCNLYPHFFLIGIYFLHRSLKKKHRRLCLCVSMTMFGLCMYCYGISIYTMPLFLLLACIYLLVSKKLAIYDALLAFVVYIAVAWPFIAVMAINFFKWDTIETPLFTLPYFPDSVRSNDILFFSDHIWAQLADNFKSLMNITLLQKKDLPWNDVEHFGTMYLFSIPFAIAGLCSLFGEFRKKAGSIFVLLFLLTGIWCGLMTRNVNINRLNIIYYPIIILTGIGIYEVILRISLPHIEWGLLAAYCLSFVLFAHTYFTDYADYMAYFNFRDFGDAVSSIKECAAQKFYITPDCRHEGASPASEILTMFWHEIDAEYYQGKTTPPGQLPYREKYTFKLISELSINPDESAAYVITADDLAYFDSTLFSFQQFGTYYVVTR